MSSPYPVLDNRPIDQWKVTELKEELKRRKLTTKGLKDDLIRRLDEAIQNELEEAKGNASNGSDSEIPPQTEKQSEDATVAIEQTKNCEVFGDNGNEKMGADTVQLDGGNLEPLGSEKLESLIVSDPVVVEAETVAHAGTLETSVAVAESVTSEEDSSGKVSHNSETRNEDGDLNPQLENVDPKFPHENSTLNASENNQLSEVSPVLVETLKSDSTCIDSVSINENDKFEDNLISDDVKLELELKPDLGQPSSRNVAPNGGNAHQMDIEEPQMGNVPVTRKEHNDAENPDVVDKNDNEDLIPSEKLILDRSSDDDSMEEDATESKQIDSKCSSDEKRDKGEETISPVVKKEALVTVSSMVDDLPKNGNDDDEKKNSLPEPYVKRKLQDQEKGGNNEPVKRQRLWNSGRLKVPETHGTSVTTTATTPKDTFQPSTKRSFSRSNSTVSDEPQKERVVPQSPKPPTNSLRIDNFLRPFTLKAVQELLGKTGTIASFWMDHIKTHCYVTYSSVGEALETRNAVYNLQWPSNGGRLLVAEFVDPQEVKMRVEVPPLSPAIPVSTGPTPSIAPLATQPPQPSPYHHVQRQQLPPSPSLPPPPPLSNSAPVKERLPLPPPPPPPLPAKVDPPIVTLDDLFRKTKAIPRIYYLPLSEEQVTSKLKAQGKNVKQSAGITCRKEPCRKKWCRSWLIDGFGFLQGLLILEAKIKLGLVILQHEISLCEWIFSCCSLFFTY